MGGREKVSFQGKNLDDVKDCKACDIPSIHRISNILTISAIVLEKVIAS